ATAGEVASAWIAPVDASRRRVGRGAQAAEAGDRDRRQRQRARHKADARRIEAGVERREGLDEAVIPEPRLVDQARAQNLREVEAEQLNARRHDRLIRRQRRAIAGSERKRLAAVAEDVPPTQIE